MVVTLSGDPAKDAFAPLSSLALRFGVYLLSRGQGSLNERE